VRVRTLFTSTMLVISRVLVSLLCVLRINLCANARNKHEAQQQDVDADVESVEIYSHCDASPHSEIHTNNGLYYVKPLADGPVIAAICSNGYTMLDPSLDLNLAHFAAYLSSWDYSRLSTNYLITNLDDTSTFRQWWLPSDPHTKFRVAAQCKSCQPSMDKAIENNVVYYTDGSNFCYTVWDDGNPCFQEVNEYACNKCDVGSFVEDKDSAYSNSYWTECQALQISADAPSLHQPQMRVNHHLIYRPVMSMTRNACTCYQANDEQHSPLPPIKYTVQRSQLPKVTAVKQIGKQDVRDAVDYIDPLIIFDDAAGLMDSSKSEKQQEIACANNVHYLSQSDFLFGTYRIRECGEYIFTEDIVCNFNAPTKEEEEADDFSPNSITADRLYWYPTRQQSQSQYPGLYTYEGSYSLGFFTGITVESDDVIINLNGFSFEMHPKFYLQQRFFSLIELAAKPFLPHQGASTWGLTEVYYANNLEIKGPGNIGLSSHHGIHGNSANNVYIHDLNVKRFDVAGIACNGCTFVKIENVMVGPQNDEIPTLGRYTHSRAFIPRLRDLNEQYGDKEIQFYGREATTVAALCQRMVKQMDMIYFNYIDQVEYDAHDEEWIAAQKVFANPTGWMDGGSSYGIVINGGGAAVVGIGTRITNTNHIQMNNVEVFGIYNQAQEKMKFSLKSGTSRGILFDVMDWIGVTDQIQDRYQSQYVGDVYTDIQFAANKFVQSWYYRNSQYIGPEEEEYVFNGNTAENDYVFLTILPELTEDRPAIGGCGTDIQLHSPKGSVGIMINGAQDSVINNVYIHDIYNWAKLGMDVCGPYNGPSLTTEDIDISYGYTATRSHGMVIDYTSGDYKDIKIENVESWHGEANGLTIYKESYINLQNVLVNNIHAGTQLNEQQVSKLTLPNLVPRACAVDIHDDTLINFVDGEDVDNIRHSNIFGFDLCDQFGVNADEKSLHYLFHYVQTAHLMTMILGFLATVVGVLCVYFLYRLIYYVSSSKHKKYHPIYGNLQRIQHVSHCDKLPENTATNANEQTPLLDAI